MDEPTLVAELIRWVMGLPAERVTWHHVALVLGGVVVWVLPAAMRLYHFIQHTRFIRTASPEQLAAYTGKLPPPQPPSLGGPLAILLLLCALGLTGGPSVAATDRQSFTTGGGSQEQASLTATPQPAKNCCKECDPPSRCVRCRCEAATKQPAIQPRRPRDERLTSRPLPLQSDLTDFVPAYEPRWQRYLPES